MLLKIIQARKYYIHLGCRVSYENNLLGIIVTKMEHTNSSFMKLVNQQLTDGCKTFLFMGNKAISLRMAWIMMLLASSLEWKQKYLVKDLKVCGEKPQLLLISLSSKFALEILIDHIII